MNFVNLRDAGDPVELAAMYAEEGADELVFLDITATVEKRETLKQLVTRVAQVINIPFTVGGGIKSVEDVDVLLNAGADKISINSAAVYNPAVINEMAANFGSQCIVLGLDADIIDGEWTVVTHGGRKPVDKKALDWALEAQERGAGEILLTSMQGDGTKAGFSNDLNAMLSDALDIPIIASGGAGNMEHFFDVFTTGKADAGLAASIFHFKEVGIQELKTYLKARDIAIR